MIKKYLRERHAKTDALKAVAKITGGVYPEHLFSVKNQMKLVIMQFER